MVKLSMSYYWVHNIIRKIETIMIKFLWLKENKIGNVLLLWGTFAQKKEFIKNCMHLRNVSAQKKGDIFTNKVDLGK